MIKKKYLKKMDSYIKGLCCILILFLIVWFSAKSLVYSLENQVPELYVITGSKKVETAKVLKKASNLETYNYRDPVDFVEREEVQSLNVKKGQNIELQSERINSIIPKNIKKEDIYFKVFTGFDRDSMKDVKIENIMTKNVTNITFKVPEEVGEYIYQIVIRYNNKNVDYVFRIRVGE